MGYKSTYKSTEIQARLKQGYYDDIVEAGILGGVFDTDTQPNKGELDLQLAKIAVGVDNCHLATIRITGVDSLSTRDDYEAFYQSVYEQLIDFRSTQKEILLDCDNLQAVARMNGTPLTEIPFVIKKAEINGSFHDSAALPVMKLHIYPLQKPDSSYCEAFVSLRMDSLENQGFTYSDSITIVEISPSDGGKIIYPEIVSYNWSNDGGDSSLTAKDVTIEQVIQKLTEKRQEIADLLEQNEAGLVYVKYGSSDLGTEERPEVYFKVEKTYSRSYTMTGYILRMTVMSPKFENDLEPSVAYIFEDGTYHIWKKDSGVTYPLIASFNWGSVSGDGSLLGDWNVDKFADRLSEQYYTILEALSYTDGRVGLVSIGWGVPMNAYSTYVKVEKSISETYMNSRNTFVATPLIGTNISSLACKIYVSGEHKYVIWKNENDLTYPYLGKYTSNGEEKNLDEMKDTFETLTRTLYNKIPENGVGIFDLYISGIGTLFVKVQNMIRQIGTSWERGMYYTVMGGYSLDFEDYMGLVWVGVGGGTGGNASAVIWRKSNKMIYPRLPRISWNNFGEESIENLADFLYQNWGQISDDMEQLEVAVLPISGFGQELLCKVEKTFQWVGTVATLGGLYITPLNLEGIDNTPCIIYVGDNASSPVIWKKEEASQTGLPKIELAIPGYINTDPITNELRVYPYIKDSFSSLKSLMDGKNAAELAVTFEGNALRYWSFFVHKSTSLHSGVSDIETNIYKIEPYTNRFNNDNSFEMKYLYIIESGEELIAKVLTYQAGMADL